MMQFRGVTFLRYTAMLSCTSTRSVAGSACRDPDQRPWHALKILSAGSQTPPKHIVTTQTMVFLGDLPVPAVFVLLPMILGSHES